MRSRSFVLSPTKHAELKFEAKPDLLSTATDARDGMVAQDNDSTCLDARDANSFSNLAQISSGPVEPAFLAEKLEGAVNEPNMSLVECPALDSGNNHPAVALAELTISRFGHATGHLDRIEDGIISGWFICSDPSAVPYVTVGGRPANVLGVGQARPDVNEVLGVTGDFGFSFAVDRASEGEVAELFAITKQGRARIDSRAITTPRIEAGFLGQLAAAKRLCQQPNSIAVVCWDGAHNPIGRAKVLYDIARTRRPAVLITYVSDDFGGELWKPLRSLDIDIITIPWASRELYHRAMANAGVKLPTVWICKPRLPSFLLAREVALPNARVVLDYDDNEEYFSQSAASRDKPYGTASVNLSGQLAANVSARTAASETLRDKFGAVLVRHARGRNAMPKTSAGPAKKIGFIGTVRTHKGILEAARAVRLYKWVTGRDVEFHVYGDVSPLQLFDELEANGAVVRNDVPMSELYEQLSDMDVVLTGFPSKIDEVTKYQISSKIGDALSIGRPVLVPAGPSTCDLSGTPGLFLFDESNFAKALDGALGYADEITLPHEFTLEGGYEAFEMAEALAAESPDASEALRLLPSPLAPDDGARPALVLIWKQHDAGLYGRRVDQLARAYAAKFPNHRVIILELMHETTVRSFQANAASFVLEHGALLRMSAVKCSRGLKDGATVIHQIVCKSSESLPALVERFLIDRSLCPTNSVIVVFPLVRFIGRLLQTLQAFPLIIDVVDNQFSWGTDKSEGKKRLQYYSLFESASRVIFNSEENKNFFEAEGLLPRENSSRVICNWYALPASIASTADRRGSLKNILYSGNMKDRIDWELLQKVAQLNPSYVVHLVGTADVAKPEFSSLLGNPNVVFHGPLQERQTLSLLETIDVAIMPHKADDVSKFMNPLKVQMYAAMGVPAVSMDVPGIMPSDLLTVAAHHDEFLKHVERLLEDKPQRKPGKQDMSAAAIYIDEIISVRKEAAERSSVDLTRSSDVNF